MPDILKITTPLVSKMDPQATKPLDPATAFSLQDIQKVIKPDARSELLKQNNGMIQQEEAPAVLMNMLKDPSVTVGFLKNIFMLQEIIQLLPINNSTMIKELENLFDALLVSPDQIASEMQRQEGTSTSFKGEIFDFLRGLLSGGKQSAETTNAVANLLKALNHYGSNEDILDAVANSLQFMGKSLEPAKELSQRLLSLSNEFRMEDAPQNFRELKNDVLSLLNEVKDSILFTPKLQKILSITIYNLSRYNDNSDFLQESVSRLITLLNNHQRSELQGGLARFFLPKEQGSEEDKTVMDVLTRIIGREAGDEKLNLMNSEKIEHIIQSLLSSPCNFTPLLHYVIPVQFDFLKAFAEIWINPNGHEDEKKQEPERGRDIHTLIVFDIQGIGHFEAELYVRDKLIDFSLFCPEPYVGAFGGIRNNLAATLAGLDYRFGNLTVAKLDKARSLMDVFKSLPYKRTGVNVKI